MTQEGARSGHEAGDVWRGAAAEEVGVGEREDVGGGGSAFEAVDDAEAVTPGSRQR